MAAWRQQLPGVLGFWQDVAARVFRDIEVTTDLDLGWRLTVREDEEWSPSRPPGVGGIISDAGPPARPRRPLAFPEVWLETPFTGRLLPAMDDDAEAACYLAEAVQDDVIEQLHGAWPPCPRQPHPLGPDVRGSGVAVWACPALSDLWVEIGSLGGTVSR